MNTSMPTPGPPAIQVPTEVVPVQVLIAAVAVAVALGVFAFVAYRLRKLDPIRFMRAVANGGMFQAILLVVVVADVAIDIVACVSLASDPNTSTNVAALFGTLTAIACVVSLVEILATLRMLGIIVSGVVDIEDTARYQRYESYAQMLTLCCEDIPMLIVSGVILASRQSDNRLLLLVVIISAVMVGAKIGSVREVLQRMLAARTYDDADTSGAELEALGDAAPEDLEALEVTLADFALAEDAKVAELRKMRAIVPAKRQHESPAVVATDAPLAASGRDADADDEAEPAQRAPRLQQQIDEADDGGNSVVAFEASATVDVPADTDADELKCWCLEARGDSIDDRVRGALKDLRERPLDMTSDQLRLDAMAVLLELAFPHRYAHLQRSAEAAAQQLTQACVSQNEFYAVVLPYLMLLYDKAEVEAMKQLSAQLEQEEQGRASDDGDGDGDGQALFEVIPPPASPDDHHNHPPGAAAESRSSRSKRGSRNQHVRRGVDATEFSSVRIVRLRDQAFVTVGADSFMRTPSSALMRTVSGPGWSEAGSQPGDGSVLPEGLVPAAASPPSGLDARSEGSRNTAAGIRPSGGKLSLFRKAAVATAVMQRHKTAQRLRRENSSHRSQLHLQRLRTGTLGGTAIGAFADVRLKKLVIQSRRRIVEESAPMDGDALADDDPPPPRTSRALDAVDVRNVSR